MSAATMNEMERLRRERDGMAAERDALALKVEKLNSKLADINNSIYGQNLHIAGWHLNGDTEPMDTWFEENDWEPETCDCTSIARLKAEWQAEVLENCENISETYFIPELGRETKVVLLDDILKVADLLRRQSEGGDDGHH